MPIRHFPTRQRGAATLVVIALLFFAMLLVVAAANRAILVEARSAANQQRSTQAFEAAEAGLEWTLAKLNDDTPIGDDCLPSGDVATLSFRDRHLHYDDLLAAAMPTPWSDAGTPRPLQAACVHGAGGWTCHCPASGAATPPAPARSSTTPAFTVELSPGAKPGLIVVSAIGCTAHTLPCDGSDSSPHEATARIEVAFGLVSGLRTPPLAALTSRGDVDAGTASLGLLNSDAGGLAVDAGGHVTGSALRVAASAGSTLEGSIASNDAALAGLDDEQFFKRWFGMSRAAWIAQPAVASPTCSDGCGSAVVAAVSRGHLLIHVPGDVAIDGPMTLGSAERPVVLVASGTLRLQGAVVIHGVVFAANIDWRNAPTGAAIIGAAMTSGGYSGDAAADLHHDAPTLDRLRGNSGTYARVAGSWKDF